MIIAFPAACIYTNQSWFAGEDGHCKEGEYKCGDSECIWSGFVCNGVRDCVNGEDEAQNCNFALITCPDGMFRCNSTGSCIDIKNQCNGIDDCKDGSDELFDYELNANDSFRCHD